MADLVVCDRCGKVGQRLRFNFAPLDWFFLEARTESSDDDTIIVYACSVVCASNQWLLQGKTGPRIGVESSSSTKEPSLTETRNEFENLARAAGLSGGATPDEILHAVKELKAFQDAVVGFVSFVKGGR